MTYQKSLHKNSWGYRPAIMLLMVCAACGDLSGETKVSRRHSEASAATGSGDQTGDSNPKNPADAQGPHNQPPSPPINPSRSKSGLSLAWDQTIKAQAFGISPTSKANGKTLEQVITSQVAGRDDGQLCSACHNQQEAQGGYGLDVVKNGNTMELDPWQKVGTKNQLAWAGIDGWVSKFINNKTKPESLKAVMRAWLDAGCKQDHDD